MCVCVEDGTGLWLEMKKGREALGELIEIEVGEMGEGERGNHDGEDNKIIYNNIDA